MLSPLPRHSDGRYCLAQSVPSYQPSLKGSSGRPVHLPFRGLLGVHSRYGLHTRAATIFRDTLHRRLQPLRYLHRCSGCFRREHFTGWAFHPLEQHRLFTAHTLSRPTFSRRCSMQGGHAEGRRFTIGMRDAAKVRQYQAGEDVENRCLAGTCAIPTPREFAVECIGEVLAVGVAKRGRAASVDTTAA